jgi:hypothetical protein
MQGGEGCTAKEKSPMKRSKKRDPSKEPLASAVSDVERHALVERIRQGDASNADAVTYYNDEQRARKKVILAKEQLASPSEASLRVFSHPDESDASAQLTVSTYLTIGWDVVKAGISARRARKKGGMGRHSESNDPRTARRYAARRAAWIVVDAEARASGKPRPRARELAHAIAAKTGEPFETIRTWIKTERKKKERLSRSVPKITLGDWNQLMG